MSNTPEPYGRSFDQPLADRARALGRELVRVHQWLRSELARIRDEIATDNHVDADQLMPLQAHCVAFCEALTRHHTSEDTVTFPALAAQLPELTPVLEQLSHDHQLVEGILRRLRELLTTVTASTIEAVRGEIDGLSAIMESHFRWEERKLTDVLDALVTEQAVDDLFGLTPPTDG